MIAPRRLYIHIGLQKTGTSYLQSIFWKAQAELARQGLDMVPGSKRDTFNLMLRTRGRYNAEFDPPEVERALDLLPAALDAAKGSRALLTEESLAPATTEQIEALLSASASREVHLVLTVRDLARQIPSAWQQLVQSGSAMGYESYLRRLRRQEGRPGARLWTSKNIEEILDRWERFVPAERIHVVTVPQSGGDPETLLRRFCGVLDVDPDRLDRDVARGNESIGRAQAEVLRRVNAYLDPRDRRRDVYGDVGKRYLAVSILGPQAGARTLVPAEYEEWCTSVSCRYVSRIGTGGFDVVGDLDDLVPAPSAFATKPDSPSGDDVAAAAAEALATILSARMERVRTERLRRRRLVGRVRARLGLG